MNWEKAGSRLAGSCKTIGCGTINHSAKVKHGLTSLCLQITKK
uniref:Uncharacterized protein n=1 Tax=Podoviridae sp. ctoqT5 TaxID=2826577 RepID=A0A8S5MPX7_9CAUD|nr:MAG TPA: hypothetical protein [Podoviridae sp. ctoqT5]